MPLRDRQVSTAVFYAHLSAAMVAGHRQRTKGERNTKKQALTFARSGIEPDVGVEPTTLR